MFLFGNRRRSRRAGHHRLFGGGLLSSLLLVAAPFLYRKFRQKRDEGRFGLREAYAGTGTEW